MKTPFFSIITVVFNGAAGFEKTAKSLLEQDFHDFEWIVVDGGSTDGTVEIAREFVDPSRDILVSEPDKGVYDAMNKGLRLARGEVVQFLNANDWFADETVLSKVSAAFDEGVGAVYGDTLLLLHDGRLLSRPASEPGATLHQRMPFSHQAFFARREIHLRYPFDLRFGVAGDRAVISQMHIDGVKMLHVRTDTNVNTIEPDAISIAGKVRSAAEDYRISVDILKRSRIEAGFYYLRKRLVAVGVSLLERLPKPIFDRLPEVIRRRTY